MNGPGAKTNSDAGLRQTWNIPPWILLGGAVIILSVFLAYLPALRGGFIWDDDAYVTANPLLTAPDGLGRIWFSTHAQSQYFPMTFTTLRLERALWGLNPLGYHLVNVSMHCANALLAWALLRRLALPGAWLAAALFALHPVQVESAAWITELKNTQSTMFYLLALLTWVKFADAGTSRRWWLYALAVVLHALALFSKTTACTLPAAMLLVLWLQRQPIGGRRLAEVAPFLVMGVSLGLVSVWWEGHLGNYTSEAGAQLSALQRLLIATRALWFYAGKLIWPVNLAFSYPRWEINPADFRQYGWAIGCLAVAAVLWFRRRTLGRGVIAAAVFYVAALSPMLGFFPLYTFYYSFVADHYQYLACLGPLALCSASMMGLAGRWRVNRYGQSAFCLVLLAALSALTWQQAGAYRDPETIWRDTLKKNPNSWLALNNLGRLLLDREETTAAEGYFRQALRLNPKDADILYNLGKVLAVTGRIDEAVANYEQAVQSRPRSATLHYNYGNLLVAAGRANQAIAQYQLALNLRPDDPDIHNNLAVAFYSTRQFDQAIAQFREALRYQPDSANFHCNLGNALLAQRKRDEAIVEYTKALQLDPGHAEAKARLRALGVAESEPARKGGGFQQ